MRGKQAAKAENRRDRAELERERDEALLAARRAEKALADEREAFEVKRAACEREVAIYREAAEKVVSPALADLRIRSEQYRLERDEAIEKQRNTQATHDRFIKHGAALLSTALGVTRIEAVEALMGIAAGRPMNILTDSRLVERVEKGELTDQQARVIDRAQYGGTGRTEDLVRAVLAEGVDA